MTQPFTFVSPPEDAFQRRVLFALELLDAVTLARVHHDIQVTGVGLRRKHIVNESGVFVWLLEDFAGLQKITIEPGVLPYEGVEIPAAQVQLPLTRIELSPRPHYAFAAGVTGLRGTVIEERVDPPIPIPNAEVQLRWLDENSVWRDAPTISRTQKKGGDFAAILRLSSTEIPLLDANGAITVRLRVRRDTGSERTSADFPLLQGRVTDPSTLNALTFAWDELQP